ncbi:hypothetical protein IFR05_006191 [Cadophora sp. M221]|nr:hypothetical protein IFR05_006191 [Cadophora sp. M221]
MNRTPWDWESYTTDLHRESDCHPLAEINAFTCWDAVTAVSLACLPNLRALSFPGWYEAFDRIRAESMHISAVVAAFGSEQRIQRNAGMEINGHLSKLRRLDLFPDCPEGWKVLNKRWIPTSLLFTMRCFFSIGSIKEMRILLDEWVRSNWFYPPPLLSTSAPIPPQPLPPGVIVPMNILGDSVVRLEKLEMVARWTEPPGVEDYLGDLVAELGKGSLKSFKLSWMEENVIPGHFSQDARNKQRILLPAEIGRVLRRVSDTLEEVVLPSDVRIEEVNFLPFGHLQSFPKLRKLEGTLNMLMGRQVEGSKSTENGDMRWDFSKEFSRKWAMKWAEDIPETMEDQIFHAEVHVMDALARLLLEEKGWGLPNRIR